MEANYFRFITQLCRDIMIEYEPERFRFPSSSSSLGVVCYIPDFKITYGRTSYYVETKGYWDQKSIEKVRLFKRHYPWLKLYLVNWKHYKLIEKYYRHRIKGWE